MAGERLNPIQQETDAGKPGRFRRAVLWGVEKSTYVTFPLSGVVFVAGAVASSGTLMVLGGAGMATDVVQNRVFKNWRNKEKQRSGKEPGSSGRGVLRLRTPRHAALQAA